MLHCCRQEQQIQPVRFFLFRFIFWLYSIIRFFIVPSEVVLNKELQERVQALRPANPMSIDQLLNPEEESTSTTQVLNDEELLEQAEKPEEQGQDELEAARGSKIFLPLSDQVKALLHTIKIVADQNGSNEILNFL